MTYIATLPQAQTPSLINFDQRLGPIEYRRPGLLKPYANNPRKHPEKQIVKLVASIRQFGFVLPVLVDGQGTIIAGQARVEAASRLGLAEIPVLVADKWTKSDVRAYRLADNRLAELSSWDGAALAIELAEIIEIGDVNFEVLGWETAEIDVIMNHCDESTSESNPVDVIPGLPKQPVIRIADIARREGLNPSWVSRMVRLNFLAPAVVEAVFAGTLPDHLGPDLLRHPELPLSWQDQLKFFSGRGEQKWN